MNYYVIKMYYLENMKLEFFLDKIKFNFAV